MLHVSLIKSNQINICCIDHDYVTNHVNFLQVKIIMSLTIALVKIEVLVNRSKGE